MTGITLRIVVGVFTDYYLPENYAIDMAQSANSLPEKRPTSPMGSSSPSDTEDSDNDPKPSGPFTPPNLPCRVSSPFNPPPFCRSIGQTSALGSTARPLDFFMLLFDDSIFDLVVAETNLYASQNHPGDRYKWYDTHAKEMKLFVGMIIAMEIHQVPQLEDYWTSESLLPVSGIVKGMPIDRFKVLLQCLHVNDNTTAKSRNDPNYDHLHRIRPLLNMSRDNFMHEYNIHREVSVDEAMVVFKGRSSLKQYMLLKPTKRGYKV